MNIYIIAKLSTFIIPAEQTQCLSVFLQYNVLMMTSNSHKWMLLLFSINLTSNVKNKQYRLTRVLPSEKI